MIKDAELEFSSAQAITASAASTNVIDQGAACNPGKPMKLVCLVDTAFDSAGDAGILAIAVQSSVDEAFTSPISHGSSPAIPQASLLAGKRVYLADMPTHGLKQYVRLYYTVTGADFTAGKLDAFLTPDAEIKE